MRKSRRQFRAEVPRPSRRIPVLLRARVRRGGVAAAFAGASRRGRIYAEVAAAPPATYGAITRATTFTAATAPSVTLRANTSPTTTLTVATDPDTVLKP